MPVSSGQGMGQYRYDNSFNYLTNNEVHQTIGMDNKDIKPKYINKGSVIVFRDVEIDLKSPIYSGKSYYLHLELPQHIQYETKVRIKLCAQVNSAEAQNSDIDTSAFQEIRELIIPPAPPIKGDQAIEEIILYSDPAEKQNPKNLPYFANIIFEWPGSTNNINSPKWIKESVYRGTSANGDIFYYLSAGDEKEPTENEEGLLSTYVSAAVAGVYGEAEQEKYKARIITEFSIGELEKRWLTASSSVSIAKFDIVFSPQYKLTAGYPYILLEIDRNDSHHTQIQYVVDKKTYYGTYMDVNYINGELWEITNLLPEENSIFDAPIKIGKDGVLNHIAIWSHPELMLAINGEEIKVGQTNFYELDDFVIKTLGIVAKDGSDRFVMDYQYRVTS